MLCMQIHNHPLPDSPQRLAPHIIHVPYGECTEQTDRAHRSEFVELARGVGQVGGGAKRIADEKDDDCRVAYLMDEGFVGVDVDGGDEQEVDGHCHLRGNVDGVRHAFRAKAV